MRTYWQISKTPAHTAFIHIDSGAMPCEIDSLGEDVSTAAHGLRKSLSLGHRAQVHDVLLMQSHHTTEQPCY